MKYLHNKKYYGIIPNLVLREQVWAQFNSYLNLPAVKILKCQMVYICANMNRFSSNWPGEGPSVPNRLRLTVYFILMLQWNKKIQL